MGRITLRTQFHALNAERVVTRWRDTEHLPIVTWFHNASKVHGAAGYIQQANIDQWKTKRDGKVMLDVRRSIHQK
jgi:hypothetical protein